MYRVLVGGEVIGYCDSPLFVNTEQSNNGVPQPVPQWEADALSFGKLYNMPGSDKIKWTEQITNDDGEIIETIETVAPEAVVGECNEAEILFTQEGELSTLKDDVATSTETYESMILEMDTFYSEQLSVLENAVLELDAALLATTQVNEEE